MANAEQIKTLIRSHAEGDDTRFYGITMQVAAQAARSGHGKFATELRKLVDQAKASSSKTQRASRGKPIPVVQPHGELAGLLTVGYPKVRLSDMALEPPLRQRIERVLLEQKQRGRIREHTDLPASRSKKTACDRTYEV